ncbi:MAG: hypothetical protein JNM17_06940 [Archangium sp.]|nr:hypothetical protein [Archangium sp.]
MARVTGKDVLVDLMSTVKALTESQARQDEDIQRIIVRLELMTERTNGLATRMDTMAAQMDEMATQMQSMTTQMQMLTTQMQMLTTQMQTTTTQMSAMSSSMGFFGRELGSLGEDHNTLRGEFVTLARHGVETRSQLNRLSGILTRLGTSTDERFDEVETRLTKLEKKTG